VVSNIISLGFKMSSRVVVERVPGRGQILRYRTLAMWCWFGCRILGQYYGDRYWVDPIGSLFETFYICSVRLREMLLEERVRLDYNDKVNKVYRGDVTADLYQNNLSLVIDIVNIVISIPAAEQTDEILVGFLLVKTS